MSPTRSAIALGALAAWLAAAPLAHATSCPVYSLERKDGGITLSREELEDGGVLVFLRDLSAGTIDVILPSGPGRSAGLLRAADRDRIIVRNAGGKLTMSVQRADGSNVDLPAREIASLAHEDIRVSVTLGDTLRRAFVIRGWREGVPDDIGPASNMFAGQLPAALMQDAAVVQTETWSNGPASAACGTAPIEIARWWFVQGVRDDGGKGWFVVDLGAAESVVARGWLPAGQAVEPLSMVEHSAAGTRRLPYAPAGATGSVQTVAGSTRFPSLAFGSARFEKPSLTVLESLPEVFGRKVVGILGMDLLRGCGHLSLEFGADGSRASLALSPGPRPGPAQSESPFSIVSSHLLVLGTLEGRRARWILDSGAPGMVIDSVGSPGLRAAAGATRKALRGLDGQQVSSESRTVGSVAAAGFTASDVACRVAPLPVFAPFREDGYALGLLGAAQLASAGAIDIDFEKRLVRWFARD